MVKLKVAELSGAVLDWAVASTEAVEIEVEVSKSGALYLWTPADTFPPGDRELYAPSSTWGQAGPLIEREGIQLRPIRCEGHPLHGKTLAKIEQSTGAFVQWHPHWFGDKTKPAYWIGDSALVAAMRCLVATRVGNEIEIPAAIANAG